MPVGDADLRIRAVADFARHHEGEDARDVRLVRERQQVVHERDVLFDTTNGMPTGAAGSARSACHIVLPGQLNAPLDLAHVLEILAHRRAIVRAELALQVGGLPA